HRFGYEHKVGVQTKTGCCIARRAPGKIAPVLIEPREQAAKEKRRFKNHLFKRPSALEVAKLSGILGHASRRLKRTFWSQAVRRVGEPRPFRAPFVQFSCWAQGGHSCASLSSTTTSVSSRTFPNWD